MQWNQCLILKCQQLSQVFIIKTWIQASIWIINNIIKMKAIMNKNKYNYKNDFPKHQQDIKEGNLVKHKLRVP